MFMTNNNLNNQAEVISRSPLIAYNMVYEFHSFDNLHNTIKRVSEKNEVSNYEIIADMETFANVYELFRPNSITQ